MSALHVIAVDTVEQARHTHLRWRQVWLVAAGGVALALLVLPFADLHAWSQLALGRHITAHGLPAAEPFSFLPAAHPWVAEGWLRDLLLAGIVAAGGTTLASLAVGLSAAGGLILAVLAVRGGDRVPRPWLAAGVVASALVARPFLTAGAAVSLLGVGAVLVLLRRWRAGSARSLWLLPPLFLLWANLDPGFIAGLFIVLVAWVVAPERPATRRALLLALVASLVAAMVNPSGPGLFTAVLADATAPGAGLLSGTFASPDFHGWSLRIFEAAAGLLVVCWVAAGRVDRLDLALGMATIAAALWSQQLIPLFAVVAAPQLAGYGGRAWRRLAAPRVRLSAQRLPVHLRGAGAVAGLAAVAIVLVAASVRLAAPAAQAAAESAQTPSAAVTHVATAYPGQRVYAPAAWGDYLAYRLPEGRVVFIYGTAGSFTPSAVSEYAAIHLLQPSWQTALHRSGVRVAVVDQRSQEAGALHEVGWRLDCFDAASGALVLVAPASGVYAPPGEPLTVPPAGAPAC
ncbi:MAG TPA: hypothetical protein VF155_12360 [Candidatus Dormibacteraeota bacterium]